MEKRKTKKTQPTEKPGLDKKLASMVIFTSQPFLMVSVCIMSPSVTNLFLLFFKFLFNH